MAASPLNLLVLWRIFLSLADKCLLTPKFIEHTLNTWNPAM